ncbi:unnamed protein product [Effrenium voratum]|nr:unnamed protein product [Effrenium voratum]|mmetsp:Transcript_80140/g.192227  ORF Transcript_80140/g.192227 Transcript_80140/m.192227 type:complete len:200 (-) Transcript_80140:261-860(-)|eukprot:CAMPEP_0181444388 /NCGR_PEP_ID=MMETSP1110-20121109/25042_1 /TAXON_ID=174948 /ORGANISM="Symbiodinium sp., Strain CCMP421" /LENGTH=199 /DNA_ID=CAMNT_0023568391 /DNA_START=101 /DNA_END=700 /DNA_ORIENTATION=-
MNEERTSLVLKRVPPRCTSAVLLEMLDNIAESRYDFVHLPYDIRNHKNLSLVFVNFTDYETARAALEWLSSAANCPQGLAPSTQVHWGQIHGLGPNLAHFIARFGIAALDPPYAPFVFVNGVFIARTRNIISRFVTLEMYRDAQRLVQQRAIAGAETIGDACEEFWRHPQHLSDLCTLPWDELEAHLVHLEAHIAIFRF